MVNDYQWIFDGIDNIDNIQPQGFLLKKDGHKRQLDSYRLKVIKTTYFRKNLKSKLEEMQKKLNNKEIKITKFYKEDTDEFVISILNADEYIWIKNTITDIFQTSATNSIGKLDNMENARFSAMLFKIPENKSIIAIDFVSIFSKAFEKFGLVATYDDIGLQELDKDAALVFKFGLPCIYFEEVHKLVVLHKKDTEDIFNLLEHYQKKANQKFNELVDEEIIEINKALLQTELKKIGPARKINNMIEEGMFITDIAVYKKYDAFLKKHDEFDDELTQLSIKNNKVIIDTKDRFHSFLYLTGYNLGQSVIDDKILFIAFQKRRIKIKGI